MKKVAYADMTTYGVPPKHFSVVSGRFQGEAETGLTKFWMGMSHYLPGGGVEWSGEDSAEEKVYFVLEGELTVRARRARFAFHRPQ
jgi:uncharacterized cupin superfamily protein